MAPAKPASAEEEAGRASRSRRAGTKPTHSRKEEVLSAALHVFAVKGYRAATIEDISNELQFTRAALYYYFDSKQDILTALVFRPIELLIEEVDEVERMDLDHATKLREALRSHLRIITEKRDLFSVMIREQMELSPDQLTSLRERNREYHRRLRKIIDDGVDAGVLASKSSDIAALFLIGSLNWVLEWWREEGPLKLEEIGEILGDLALYGLVTRLRS